MRKMRWRTWSWDEDQCQQHHRQVLPTGRASPLLPGWGWAGWSLLRVTGAHALDSAAHPQPVLCFLWATPALFQGLGPGPQPQPGSVLAGGTGNSSLGLTAVSLAFLPGLADLPDRDATFLYIRFPVDSCLQDIGFRASFCLQTYSILFLDRLFLM